MSEPFTFQACVVQVELTGKRARTLGEFSEMLQEVPDSSIFHHLHHTFLRHHLELPEFTNDFSNWAAQDLEDRALAEKLANIAPFHFEDVAALREHIEHVVAEHLRLRPQLADLRVPPFYFDSGTTLVLAGEQAANLGEFRSLLTQVDSSSIYYHIYESRLRKQTGSDDFSAWFEENFQAPALVSAVRAIDPYMHSLEHLRALLLNFLDQYGPATNQGGGV